MAEANGVISAQWEAEVQYQKGPHGYDEPVETIPSQVDQAGKELLDKIEGLVCGSLFDELCVIHGIQNTPRVDAYKRLVFGAVHQSSYLLLIDRVIRQSRKQGTRIELSGEAWANLAFRERNLDYPGRGHKQLAPSPKYFERVSGIKDPDMQRRSIGAVAASIIQSGVLTEPCRLFFWDQIATLQTVHND